MTTETSPSQNVKSSHTSNTQSSAPASPSDHSSNSPCPCKTCASKSTLDAQWDLIASFFEDKSFVRSQINSYNELINKYIPDVIERLGTITIQGDNATYTYSLLDPVFTLPCHREFEGELTYVTPSYCRLRDLTYQSNLFCRLVVETNHAINGVSKKAYEKVLIAQIPVMVKSDFCSLQKATQKELCEKGECIYEHGGYFIVNGSEKVIIGQERMAHNQIFCYQNQKTGNYSAELRCIPEGVSKAALQVAVRYTVDAKTSKNFPTATLQVNIPHTKREFPAIVLFRALGIDDDNVILDMITPDRDPRVLKLLQPSFDEAIIIQSQTQAMIYCSQFLTSILPSQERQLEHLRYILSKDFLPHIGTETSHDIAKAFLLGHTIHKCLMVYLGEIDCDDRDHFGNKRIDLAGNLIGTLFRLSFSRVMKEFRRNLEKTKIINSKTDFAHVNITKQIRNSLSTGNWGSNSSKSTHTGVTQPLQRITYIATIAHLRRLIAPIAKEGKSAKPRQLHNSSIFMTCPSDTPESDQVGLIKNMSMLMEISVESPGASIRELLADRLVPHLPVTPGCTLTKVFVNGVCQGCVEDSDTLFRDIKIWKRRGYIPATSGVIYNKHQRELNVVTDGGRSIRPVLYVEGEDPQMFLHKLKSVLEEGKTWTEICTMGFVEYIDSKESENMLCAMTVDDFIKNPMGYSYTHMEIHPSMLLGACASTIPYSNHTQAPRVSYQSSQMKQALGVYSLNVSTRFDAQAHMMWYPQKPLVPTRMGKLLKIDEMPAGVNAVVAIMCYGGYNQEDSIIVNRSAIDRGLFRSTYFKSWKSSEARHGTSYEEFTIPDEARVQLENGTSANTSSYRYDLLDKDDGLVGVGLRVSDHDVIMGKVLPLNLSNDPQAQTNNKTVRKDISVKMEYNEEGVVDSVLLAQNEYGRRMSKIRLRQTRIPEVGDKLASNCAQKGVCSLLLSQEDMPFNHEGIPVDIIINPHCIPSRMTINQMLSTVGAKLAALGIIQGTELAKRLLDSTAFQSVGHEEVGTLLKKAGYHPHGYEQLYHGATGEPINAQIFVGPTYYQRLKHMVADKHHSRRCGKLSMLTRQPSEGKSKQGGLRFGEMERDALIAHAASSLLNEKLFQLSDVYSMPVCTACGLIGAPSKPMCKSCGERLVMVSIPYAAKLLMQELCAMNIAVRINTKGEISPIQR